MIKLRIISAIVVVGFVLLAVRYDLTHRSGYGFAAVMALLSVPASREFYRMCRARGWRPFALFGTAVCPLLYIAHERWCLEKWHGAPRMDLDLLTTFIAVAVMGIFLLQLTRKTPEGAIGNVATTLLGLIYIWFLPSFLQRIRHLGMPGVEGWNAGGLEFLLVAIFGAKASDIGGLLVGSKLGRHKLCPVLSPKKTWEGLIGGVVFSMVVVCIVAAARPGGALHSLGWPLLVLLGAVLAVAALLGDLVESSFKRASEVKDAGGSVPGFGGVLDLVDSLMVSAPVMYFFLLLAGARHAVWG